MKTKFLSKWNPLILSICVVLLCAANLHLTVQAASEVQEMSETGKITTDSLNVRSGPGKEYEAIGKVYSTDTVKITGEASGWYRISYDGTEGYISAQYVTLEEASQLQEAQPSAADEAGEDEEELAPTFLQQYKIPLIVGGIILVVLLIMVFTVKGIRSMDEDEEDDEDEDDYDDDEYDDEEDEDDDEYDEDDEDEDDYEPVVRRKAKRAPVRREPVRREREYREPPRREQEYREPVRKEPVYREEIAREPVRRTAPPQPAPKRKELDLRLSNNPDDYRIEIDPIYFEDNSGKKHTVDNQKDADLQQAMKKMEELQREIERIKNQQ